MWLEELKEVVAPYRVPGRLLRPEPGGLRPTEDQAQATEADVGCQLGSWDGRSGRMGDPSHARHGEAVTLPDISLLDQGLLPVEELAAFATREASRPRPAYLAHRWFARRFGTAMRALLVGAATPADGDFWDGFYGRTDQNLVGLHVCDTFVGGGTIAYEAQRLGATVTGIDVDPVACAISRFELRAAGAPDPSIGLDEVWRAVGKTLAGNYRTTYRGQPRIGLHYFWVQQVSCGGCGTVFDAHPSHLLGADGRMGWVMCAGCGEVHHQSAALKSVQCDCGHKTRVDGGTAKQGSVTCPWCSRTERLLDVAARTGAPEWRMFAVESLPNSNLRRVPLTERTFHKATGEDLARYEAAAQELDGVRDLLPKALIPRSGRTDDRLVGYGYRRYTDLFNDRQLLHLARLSVAIRDLDVDQREMLGLALSNHTLSNCMLTTYTPRWRQVTPLFVVRSFRHSVRPVEINPWLAGVGRGTFPNSVRKVDAARRFAKEPVEFTADGYEPVPAIQGGPTVVLNSDSRDLTTIRSGSVHLVVTDPPYLDNIAYSELSDFFVPWLIRTGVLTKRKSDADKQTLAAAARNRTAKEAFSTGLTAVFREAHRILRPDGRLVFTFQHKTSTAWVAIAEALKISGFAAVHVLPLKGDGDKGLHHHTGSSTWDAVFVLRLARRSDAAPSLRGERHIAALDVHIEQWATRLNLGDADRAVLRHATYAAGAVGFLATDERAFITVTDALGTAV